MFNFFANNKEWNIYNGATREFIDLYGIPCKYMKKELIKPDYLFGEENGISEFNEFFDIKVYLEDMTRMGGQADLFTKFGLRVDDTLTLLIHQDTILSKLGPDRFPQPDDLVYFPFNNNLFEIYHVEEKEVFFPFGHCTTFKLLTRLMHYNHEKINTGVEEIDEAETLGVSNFDLMSENTFASSVTTISSYYKAPTTSTTATLDTFIATISNVLDFTESDPFKDI